MGGDTKGMWPETLSIPLPVFKTDYIPISSSQGSAAKVWARFDFKLVKQLLQACQTAFNAKFGEDSSA